MQTVFTPATLAERWGCSERHVRNLISEGKLGSFRLGGKLVRIRQSDVEDFECQSGGLHAERVLFISFALLPLVAIAGMICKYLGIGE